MFCTKCGRKINDDALFCTGCGARVKENELVHRTDNGNTGGEKIFRVKSNIGIMYLGGMVGFLVAAIMLFYQFSELPKYFYSEEREVLFTMGLISALLAVEFLALMIGRTKVKLCIGSQTISGIAARGIIVGEFEYSYNEISEVKCILGSVQVRVNGKWVVIPGLENKEKAKKMIEERLLII